MKSRELEADLAQLYSILPKPKGRSGQDHHHIILPRILAFDASKFFPSFHSLLLSYLLDHIVGYRSNREWDFRDPNNLQLTVFVNNAWRFHVRIINWPVDVPFINCGVQTANGFLPGYKQIHGFSAGQLAAICSIQVKALIAEAEGKTSEDTGLGVEMVTWDEGNCLQYIEYSPFAKNPFFP